MSTAPSSPLPDTLPASFSAEHTRTEYPRGSFTPAWDDYAVSITLRGRAYPIAELTRYPDGEILVTKSASIRTSTAHAAWNNLVRALGGDPSTARAMFCTRWDAQ